MFVKESMRWDRLTKPRFLLGYLFAPWLFILGSTSELQLRIGIPIVLLGIAVRFWANGHVGHVKVNWAPKSHGSKIGRLVTAGPYAYIRNPLYFGSLLIGVGLCIIGGEPLLSVIALGCLLVAYRRKILQEEQLLRGEWGEAYDQYCKVVPAYFPTWRRYPGPRGQWDWQGIWASKEPKTLIWVIAVIILLYLREEFVEHHGRLFDDPHRTLRLCLLGLAIVLAAGDGLFELIRRRTKRTATIGR